MCIQAELLDDGCFDFAGDKALAEFDLCVIRDFDDEAVVFHTSNSAEKTASRDDFIALLDLREHLIMRFLALALWRDDEKPHAEKQQDNRQELAKAAACGRCLSKRKKRINFWKCHKSV